MSQISIDIGRDFSPVPAGRHPEDGEFNGEAFRTSILEPALRKYDRVEVVLDQAEGFGSSFLEEAFGGLVRVGGFSPAYLQEHLFIVAGNRFSRYRNKIFDYINMAA